MSIGIFGFVILMLLATSFFGTTVNGSKRWLPIPGLFSLQTSDLAKIGVILITARVLHQDDENNQGLTLNDIFRPLNVSRPIMLIIAVLVIGLGGDSVRTSRLKKKVGNRMRTVASLTSDKSVAIAGRGEKADIKLGFAGTSEAHAQFRRVKDGQYTVEPATEGAHVEVNGDIINGVTVLKHNDVIRLGKTGATELNFAAPIIPTKRRLPWIAVFAALWLFVSVYQQTKKNFTFRDLVAPIA